MTEDPWSAVDEFVCRLLTPHDEALDAALQNSEAAGLPAIQVSAPQGMLLAILVRAIGATTALEFGTLGAYSTIWIARALAPGGRLITLEAAPGYAEVAAGNIECAGLSPLVDLRVGPALETLALLESEGVGPFDFTFIDADKENSPRYFSWALDHSRPGALIVADNVVRGGALADSESDDRRVRAQRELHQIAAADPRVRATTIQTVGAKGYDGFLLALVQV